MIMVEDNVGNQFRPNAVQNVGNQYGNRNVVTTPAEGNGNGINGIQSTQEEFEFMATADAYEESERVKASTSSSESDKAHIYDSNGSAEVSEQKDTTHGTSTNTKFAKQSILGKPPSSSRPKMYAVTPLSKSKAIPKIDKSHALSKPVTSNSVWKPKNVGSKERLASPKPSTPRSCLRWSPTGRISDLKGKIIATSEFECQSDCFKGNDACTSNPQEPISKRFPNSTFSMTGGQNWFDTLLISLLSEYKPMDKEDHRDNECDT
nr:hypothetical protein [Tanacetum cinerariifolium]GEV64757.1 hypothetical protein [Tanacetum cinerariifolium]